MKKNFRFVVAAVILAAVAVLGFSRGAWAGPLMAGTVPGCSMSDTGHGEPLDTCYSNATFYGGLPSGWTATLTDYGNNSALYPNPVPGGGGPLVRLNVVDAAGNNVLLPGLMTLCFPDPTGMSVIFRWWTASDYIAVFGSSGPEGWRVAPSYNANGLVCTQTFMTGIFREIY